MANPIDALVDTLARLERRPEAMSRAGKDLGTMRTPIGLPELPDVESWTRPLGATSRILTSELSLPRQPRRPRAGLPATAERLATSARVLQPEETGRDDDETVMTYRDGRPVYYGTAESYDEALEGLLAVKRRYGTNSRRFREAAMAAAGVLGPTYEGPTLEEFEQGARNA